MIAGAPGLSGADEEEVNFARDFVAHGILHWVDALHAGQRLWPPGDESNHTRLSVTTYDVELMPSSFLPSGSSTITASGGVSAPVSFHRISVKKRALI